MIQSRMDKWKTKEINLKNFHILIAIIYKSGIIYT